MEPADPDKRFFVRLSLEAVSSCCRFCLRRTGYKPVVVVNLMDSDSSAEFTFYCTTCYKKLRELALPSMPSLPALEHFEKKPDMIRVPAYLIKDNDPFKLFFPDPIDLGLWRQKLHGIKPK